MLCAYNQTLSAAKANLAEISFAQNVPQSPAGVSPNTMNQYFEAALK